MAPSGSWTMVVLTGGRSRRMGTDKAHLEVGGVTLLDRLVASVPASVPVVVVGPDRATQRPVQQTREMPPGGGPVAGIAAALPLITDPVAVVAAVDLPFAGPLLPGLAAHLSADESGADGVVPVAAGRLQPLCAAYRTRSLRGAVARLPEVPGASMRALLDGLRLLTPPGDAMALADVDTPEQLAHARGLAARPAWEDGIGVHRAAGTGSAGRGTIMGGGEEDVMDEWVAAAAQQLGVSGDVDIDLVLDVAKDAAHRVQRPAAPVTTYLLGAAVAGGLEPAEAARRIRELAAQWPQSE